MDGMRIEQALDLLRGRLVEWVAEDNWCEHRWAEVAHVMRECFRGVPPPLTREELRRVGAFVRGNLESKLTWEEIAAGLGMEPFSLGRRFKSTAGITLHQYVIRCRMRKAMKLVAEGRSSLADVAFEVGCSCQSHLTTLFRKHFGVTPGEVRRRALSNFGDNQSERPSAATRG